MGYDQVFVLAAEMAKRGEEWVFLPEDEHGFLYGGVRIEAANILREQGMVKELIVVGGPTEDRVSKVQLMAERIKGKVTQLESGASTGGNLGAIEQHLSGGNNGILTQWYHLPRTCRMAADRGLHLIPICAEAVLLMDNPHWMEKIRKWYSSQAMFKRTLEEISGLSDLEAGRYQ